MNFPHGVMVTVRSVSTTDDGLGNTSETVTESAWGPCAVWDRYANESTDTRVPPVVVGITIAGPRRAIDSNDRLVLDGVVYEVDGLPQLHTVSPYSGWDPGIAVDAKRAASV